MKRKFLIGKVLTKASSSVQIKWVKYPSGLYIFYMTWKVMKTLDTMTLFIVIMNIHQNKKQLGMGGNEHINST